MKFRDEVLARLLALNQQRAPKKKICLGHPMAPNPRRASSVADHPLLATTPLLIEPQSMSANVALFESDRLSPMAGKNGTLCGLSASLLRMLSPTQLYDASSSLIVVVHHPYCSSRIDIPKTELVPRFEMSFGLYDESRIPLRCVLSRFSCADQF
jgi:hypothetical protein